MDPLTSAAIGAAGDIAKGVVQGRRSALEKAYAKNALSELERLKGGEGGMSASKRAKLTAEGLGKIDATMADAKREALRGANLGSGKAFTAQKDLTKARLGAEAQLTSSIREQDLEEAARLRNEAYMKAAMAEDMRHKRLSRMQEATKETDIAGDLFDAGQAERDALARRVR
ncbi:MAG: hypothetical protein Unbinned2514contig1000_22 [Prokaryotic dsDNA virus sp.]|nr:MAG: hypothetical protein Unbinned2514contig1000_22 [Prokaryotic dsDNA virus sp.]|tara:strand:- start:1653 stop:2168 length:516 start_codon:yes stop_codon:yes gene_type:complete